MRSRYRRAPSGSTPTIPSPRFTRLRTLRIEVRKAGSTFIDAAQMLQGRDYALAARMVDGSQRLLDRLATLARRASS